MTIDQCLYQRNYTQQRETICYHDYRERDKFPSFNPSIKSFSQVFFCHLCFGVTVPVVTPQCQEAELLKHLAERREHEREVAQKALTKERCSDGEHQRTSLKTPQEGAKALPSLHKTLQTCGSNTQSVEVRGRKRRRSFVCLQNGCFMCFCHLLTSSPPSSCSSSSFSLRCPDGLITTQAEIPPQAFFEGSSRHPASLRQEAPLNRQKKKKWEH